MMTAPNVEQGMRIGELLDGLVEIKDSDMTTVTGLCPDSRKVRIGDLFCARSGTRAHAASFIPQAVQAGAVAVLMEGNYELQLPRINIPVYQVNNFNQVLGEVASRFFGRPSEHIPVIGVTGTNGKTSITWLLSHAMSDADHAAGMIGTLGIGLPNNIKESVNTTPDVITVHGSIATLLSQGARYIAMEVSSHALAQERVAGIRFNQAVFTNLSREHLDYHVSVPAYAQVKRGLFTDYEVKQKILNIDDSLGHEMWQEMRNNDPVYGFSLDKPDSENCERVISGRVIENNLHGLTLSIQSPWGEGELHSSLLGEFNAANLLACVTSMCLSGFTLTDTIGRLEKCPSVPGRMERFGNDHTPLVIVDYAHTPDALENVLKSLKRQTRGELFCVFGCGGERDTGKRPEMGRVADQYADHIVVTNDNPRGEDPEAIIQDILAGIERTKHLTIEPDRSSAITSTIRQASQEDVVLVAGKGHESSQVIKGEYLPFSDRSLVRACLEAW